MTRALRGTPDRRNRAAPPGLCLCHCFRHHLRHRLCHRFRQPLAKGPHELESNPPLARPDPWHPGGGAGHHRCHPGDRPGAAGVAGARRPGQFARGHLGGARGAQRPTCRRNPPSAIGCHRGVQLCRGPAAGVLRGPRRWPGAGCVASLGAAALGEEPAPLTAVGRRRALGCSGHCADHGLAVCLCPGAVAAAHGRLAAAGGTGAWLAGAAHPRGYGPCGARRAVPHVAHGADHERIDPGAGGAGHQGRA